MSNTIKTFNEYPLSPDEVLIWWLGSAGFYFRTLNKKIIIDPYLSNSVYNVLKPLFQNAEKELSRLVSLPLKPGEISCDYYFCTHDHLDHLDPETVSGIKDKSSMTFIGPESCAKHLGKLGVPANSIKIIRRGESLQLDHDCHVTAFHAKHRGSLNIAASLKSNKEIYNEDDGQGYILSIDHINIYHTSDTESLAGFKDLKEFNIDILLLAANGKGGNLTAEEGIRLIKVIKPKVIIPMHYGIIPYTDSDPAIIKKLLMGTGVDSKLKILHVGGFYLYKKGNMK